MEEEIAAGSGGRVSHLEAGTADEVWRIIFPLGVSSPLRMGVLLMSSIWSVWFTSVYYIETKHYNCITDPQRAFANAFISEILGYFIV